MSLANTVNYRVEFKDAGEWFEGYVPAEMKTCKRVREHYEAGGFGTRLLAVIPPVPAHTCDELGPWGCDHPDCIREAQLQQQGEIDAENAWLRAAEAPTADDYAFEEWEAQRCFNDPQGGYGV